MYSQTFPETHFLALYTWQVSAPDRSLSYANARLTKWSFLGKFGRRSSRLPFAIAKSVYTRKWVVYINQPPIIHSFKDSIEFHMPYIIRVKIYKVRPRILVTFLNSGVLDKPCTPPGDHVLHPPPSPPFSLLRAHAPLQASVPPFARNLERVVHFENLGRSPWDKTDS